MAGQISRSELGALEQRAREFEASITMEANPLDLSDEGDALAAKCERAAAAASSREIADRAAMIGRRVEATRKIVAQLVALKRTQLCC